MVKMIIKNLTLFLLFSVVSSSYAENNLLTNKWYYKIDNINNTQYYIAVEKSDNFIVKNNQKQHLILRLTYGGDLTSIAIPSFYFQDFRIKCDNGCQMQISFDDEAFESFYFENNLPSPDGNFIFTSFSSSTYLSKKIINSNKMSVKIKINEVDEYFMFTLSNLGVNYKKYFSQVINQ